ncbi:MAG: hypothetical protein P8181_05905 [bacterium]
MKNKLRLIDVSMLSTYMGRALTGFVTLFVIAVAVGAWLSGGGRGFDRGVITVCVHALPEEWDARRIFEPFRSLLSAETRRPVVVTECGEERPAGFELYVLPVDEYFRYERPLGIRALFEIQSSARRIDKAVVVSREPIETGVPKTATVNEFVFTRPMSVNGFWVQADALERTGLGMPTDLRDLEFTGSAAGGSRAVFDVLCGAYRFGACKLSEITDLLRDGSMQAGELHVWDAGDALPEVVIAARGSLEYYERKLGSVAGMLDEVTSPPRENETVALLKSRGVRRLVPLGPERISETRRLFERYGVVFDSTRVVSP